MQVKVGDRVKYSRGPHKRQRSATVVRVEPDYLVVLEGKFYTIAPEMVVRRIEVAE